MAKMKTFAVEVEYTVTKTIYVEARRPNGAAEKALTPEEWSAAHAYDCVEDCYCAPSTSPKGTHVTKVRTL